MPTPLRQRTNDEPDDGVLRSFVMVDFPRAAPPGGPKMCDMCGGNGRLGVIQTKALSAIKVVSCPTCQGTGKLNLRGMPKFQFELRTLLLITLLVPPVLGWAVWLVGQFSVLGWVLSILPLTFFGGLAAIGLFKRRLRWLTIASLILCGTTMSLIFPSSHGSEFLEATVGVAIISTAAGAFILVILGIGISTMRSAYEQPCR